MIKRETHQSDQPLLQQFALVGLDVNPHPHELFRVLDSFSCILLYLSSENTERAGEK